MNVIIGGKHKMYFSNWTMLFVVRYIEQYNNMNKDNDTFSICSFSNCVRTLSSLVHLLNVESVCMLNIESKQASQVLPLHYDLTSLPENATNRSCFLAKTLSVNLLNEAELNSLCRVFFDICNLNNGADSFFIRTFSTFAHSLISEPVGVLNSESSQTSRVLPFRYDLTSLSKNAINRSSFLAKILSVNSLIEAELVYLCRIFFIQSNMNNDLDTFSICSFSNCVRTLSSLVHLLNVESVSVVNNESKQASQALPFHYDLTSLSENAINRSSFLSKTLSVNSLIEAELSSLTRRERICILHDFLIGHLILQINYLIISCFNCNSFNK